MSIDIMKTIFLQNFFLLILFTCATAKATEPLITSDGWTEASESLEQNANAPLVLRPDMMIDFKHRLDAALEKGDLPALKALYPANAAADVNWPLELSKWSSLVDKENKGKVTLWFKEFSQLPPKAYEFWSQRARQLTQGPVSHLVFLSAHNRRVVMLPLATMKGQLLILPSDLPETETKNK